MERDELTQLRFGNSRGASRKFTVDGGMTPWQGSFPEMISGAVSLGYFGRAAKFVVDSVLDPGAPSSQGRQGQEGTGDEFCAVDRIQVVTSG
jgi:hypothetical protein